MKFFVICVILMVFIEPGNPMRIRKQASSSGGQLTSSCNEGDIIVQQSIYKYKCTNGVPKLASCLASPRANNAELQVNETRTIDGFWYKCTEENGQPHYSEEPRCQVGDKAIRTNETSVIGNLVFFCNPNGIQVTGCVFTDENGKLIQKKVGESAVIGSTRHVCAGLTGPNGQPMQPGANQTSPNGPSMNDILSSCVGSDGQEHKTDDTWKAKNFRYVCSGGQAKIVACVIDEKNEVAVGQTVAKFGLLHHCTKEGNRVSYRSEICGVGNVNCDQFANPVSNGQDNRSSGQPHQSIGGNSGTNGNGTQNGCVKGKQFHPIGTSWLANNFKYLCQNDGSATIQNCVTDSGREIGIGEVWVLSGIQHTCSPRPNGADYSTQTCGSQVQCGPEGLQPSKTSGTSLPRLQP